MRHDFPMYEGDGIFRRPDTPESAGMAASTPSLLKAAGKTPFAGPFIDIREIEARARQLRADTIGGLLTRLFDWFDARVRRARYRDLERYLSESTDVADLERRLRQIGHERANVLAGG